MPRRLLPTSLCAYLLIAGVIMFGSETLDAQSTAMPGGSVSGVVTATGANGETINAANVLVQLWTTDVETDAKRDSACATWLADKTTWLQAKGEMDTPSGVSWTGTPIGRDLALLQSLMALRRDTVRADANGTFIFPSVPFGAYTIEAEMYANDKFLQWSKDAAVIPNTITRVTLDASTLAENQYCETSSAVGSASAGSSGAGRVYDAKDLDKPLTLTSGGANSTSSTSDNGTVTIDFVVNASGAPDLQTVRVRQTTGGPIAVDDARTIVSKLRYSAPMVKGVAVRANAEYVAPLPSSGRRRGRH
jgi:hypothetical protein